ncbi:hypothetical protein vseg_018301 [Gypsophila vaccaria]
MGKLLCVFLVAFLVTVFEVQVFGNLGQEGNGAFRKCLREISGDTGVVCQDIVDGLHRVFSDDLEFQRCIDVSTSEFFLSGCDTLPFSRKLSGQISCIGDFADFRLLCKHHNPSVINYTVDVMNHMM